MRCERVYTSHMLQSVDERKSCAVSESLHQRMAAGAVGKSKGLQLQQVHSARTVSGLYATHAKQPGCKARFMHMWMYHVHAAKRTGTACKVLCRKKPNSRFMPQPDTHRHLLRKYQGQFAAPWHTQPGRSWHRWCWCVRHTLAHTPSYMRTLQGGNVQAR